MRGEGEMGLTSSTHLYKNSQKSRAQSFPVVFLAECLIFRHKNSKLDFSYVSLTNHPYKSSNVFLTQSISMFDEAFTKLDVDETAVVLDVINKTIQGSLFDPLETTILSINLPFYPGYRFFHIADHATHPPLERFVFHKEGTQDYTTIDWRFDTIYGLNKKANFKLDEKSVLEYVRFFFSYVKGRHGKFILCESADHVKWKDEPPAEVRKSLNQALKPLELKEKTDNGGYVIKAYMMLKDTLFTVIITVDKGGQVGMTDHEILIENIPVLDSLMAS